ncbi:MAG TPA: branched-chain amino acid ABC transporter permease [Burkholderiales bacterium]|nr:branched-chain amino acid ABC transporter permease [Burkholderiales bacterium]
MDLHTFLIQLLNGVQYGLLLFLVASGLTLVFGIMGIINVAHGSFYMIGAYLAWSLTARLGSFWIAVPAAIVVAAAVGVLLEWLVIRRLYDRDHLYQVLLTYGLILVFEEMRSLLWGDDVRGVPVPASLGSSIPLTETLSYPVYRLFISGVCLAVALLIVWVIQKTRLGMIIRAGSVDRQMVQALGIDVHALYRVVFAAGITLAAFAGMVSAPVSAIAPGMGNPVLIVCFVIIVIGGMGSVKGAMLASLLIGLVDTFGKVVHVEIGGLHVLPELSSMTVYLLMAVVLLWRPEGIFGRRA